MQPIRDKDQVYLPKRKPTHTSHVWLWVGGGVTIAVVLVGWVFTISGVLTRNVQEAKSSFRSASSIAEEIRRETADERAEVAESGSEIRGLFDPVLEAAKERDEAVDIVAEIVKENLEEPEGEGGEEPVASAPTDTPEEPVTEEPSVEEEPISASSDTYAQQE